MADHGGLIVVLFGAPTVGKDTVSAVLAARSPKYEHFIKHKRGAGSKHGYTMVSDEQLVELRDAGRIVSEVDRYGATYAIERDRLTQSLAAGRRVLIHSAETAEALALVALGARLILLECSRATATARLRRRDPETVDERLKVWDLVDSRLDALAPEAILRLATDALTPDEVADNIERTLDGHANG